MEFDIGLGVRISVGAAREQRVVARVRSGQGVALHLVMTGVPHSSPLHGIKKAEPVKDEVIVMGCEFVVQRRYVTRLPRNSALFEEGHVDTVDAVDMDNGQTWS
eukprot:9034338-Heterocapsa_arctica.AAC.1